MKKQILFLSAFLISLTAISQYSFSPTVIAASGGLASSSGFSLSYTVAEMTAVQTFTGGGYILNQGFQQPIPVIADIPNPATDNEASFFVYPNPATNLEWFSFQFSDPGELTATLYNSLGQKMATVFQASYQSGEIREPVAVSNLARGVYFLSVSFSSTTTGREFSISKKIQVMH